MNKKSLRTQLKAKLKQLKPHQIELAKHRCANLLAQHPAWQSAHNIGIYNAINHELSLEPLIDSHNATNKKLYLPRIHSTQSGVMTFHHWQPQDPQINNKYGVAEPLATSEQIACHQLDLIILPCLGLTQAGIRLGTGGGYYDRYLAKFKNSTQKQQHSPTTLLQANRETFKPLIIGVGYDVQLCQTIPTDPWDQICDLVFIISTKNQEQCS